MSFEVTPCPVCELGGGFHADWPMFDYSAAGDAVIVSIGHGPARDGIPHGLLKDRGWQREVVLPFQVMWG